MKNTECYTEYAVLLDNKVVGLAKSTYDNLNLMDVRVYVAVDSDKYEHNCGKLSQAKRLIEQAIMAGMSSDNYIDTTRLDGGEVYISVPRC